MKKKIWPLAVGQWDYGNMLPQPFLALKRPNIILYFNPVIVSWFKAPTTIIKVIKNEVEIKKYKYKYKYKYKNKYLYKYKYKYK